MRDFKLNIVGVNYYENRMSPVIETNNKLLVYYGSNWFITNERIPIKFGLEDLTLLKDLLSKNISNIITVYDGFKNLHTLKISNSGLVVTDKAYKVAPIKKSNSAWSYYSSLKKYFKLKEINFDF